MSIKDSLARLVALQEQDKRLDCLRAAIAKVPKEIAALQEQAAAERAAVAAAKERATQAQLQRKEKELELAQKEEAARKHSQELNQVKTNEAFKALQSEIERAKAQAGELETQILMLMDEGERLAKEEKAKAVELKAAEARIAEQVKALEARKAELEAELSAEAFKREALIQAVAPDALSQYEGLRRRRQGVAMARLKGSMCSVCHMIQTPQSLVNLAKGSRLICCDSCQRILYNVEAELNPPVA